MDISLINTQTQKGLILENLDKNDNLVKNTLLDLGNIIDGTFTFGTGITAMLPAVKELMSGKMPELGEQEVILLYITAIWILANKHKEKINKLLSIIKEKRLGEAFSVVLDFLKSVENIALKIGKSLGYTANNLVDVVGFTFIAFPILDGLLFLMNQGLINPGSPTGYLKSVLFGVGIIGFKNIFNHIIKKLGGRLKPLEGNKETLNEQSDFYDETIQMTNDVMGVIKKTITDTSTKTYYLPEDINPNEMVYEMDDFVFTIELTIGRDETLDDEFHIEAYYVDGEDVIEIVLMLNPLMEPESYDHIENYLVEYIRHEIRHAEQELLGTKPKKINRSLEGLPYYTQDHEIDAQTSGLNARRIKQGRSFEEVIRGSVENTKLRHGLSDEEGEQLYDILLKDITERYGKESLQESNNSKKNMVLDVGDEIIVIHKSTLNSLTSNVELFKPYEVTGFQLVPPRTIDYKKGFLEPRRKYFLNPSGWSGKGTSIYEGHDEWILRPGSRNRFRPDFKIGEDLYEQTESTKEIPKKVILDNEKYKIYVPINSKDICNIPNTEYCGKYNSHLIAPAHRGTPYIVEFKNQKLPYFHKDNSNQILIIDHGKIPFLREPKSTKTAVSSNGRPIDIYEYLSDQKELQKFFKLVYSLSQRIKFGMEFTEDEMLDGKEHSKLGEVIYNIANKTMDPDELTKFLGSYDVYEEPGYHARVQGVWGEDEIEILPDGINVYLKREDYLENVLGIDSDDEWFYSLAYGLYGESPYDEVDNEELNYMACWFSDEDLRKFIELKNKILNEDTPLNKGCNDFREGEIADFLESFFPYIFNKYSAEMLDRLGHGLGKHRQKEMKNFLDNEIFLDTEHLNRNYVKIHIKWEPLLYLVQNYLSRISKSLSTLFSDDLTINAIHDNLSDIYWDSWDYDEETAEDIRYEISNMLDEIESEYGENYGNLNDFMGKVTEILDKHNFRKNNYGMYAFSKNVDKDTIPPDSNLEKIEVKINTITPGSEKISVDVHFYRIPSGFYRVTKVLDYDEFVEYMDNKEYLNDWEKEKRYS